MLICTPLFSLFLLILFWPCHGVNEFYSVLFSVLYVLLVVPYGLEKVSLFLMLVHRCRGCTLGCASRASVGTLRTTGATPSTTFTGEHSLSQFSTAPV